MRGLCRVLFLVTVQNMDETSVRSRRHHPVFSFVGFQGIERVVEPGFEYAGLMRLYTKHFNRVCSL